ncbi:MAG TPA: serine hydrolase domain-containing protein [Blastocatellia bacterium]|nr:serine hydrolase domain-containing protein [Blastocatellia bacterium]
MKTSRHARLLWLFLLVLSASVCAQSRAEIEGKRALIEQWVTAEMAKEAIPGVAIAVAKDGKTVFAKGFGYADLENKVPFTAQTVSRIGSISKTFTATAVMQLVEQGKINLDAEVQTYVPDFPKKNFPITVRQLLCHQGGIRHYKGAEMLSAVNYNTVDAALAIFRDDPLVNEPGTAYSYSTYGYNLLSKVVESASGEQFGDYLQRHILDPLGLKQTYLDQRNRLIPNRAHNYTKPKDGELQNAPAVDQSNKWGGGGLVSTVEDLIRYAAAYDGSALLKPETIKMMVTAQKTRDGKQTAYGLGWATGIDKGHRRIEHTGGSVGATSALARYPEEGLTIAVLVNCDHYGAPKIRAKISEILFEATPAQ